MKISKETIEAFFSAKEAVKEVIKKDTISFFYVAIPIIWCMGILFGAFLSALL